MSGLLLDISLQGVKVSRRRYQIPTCLFVLRHQGWTEVLSSWQNEIISLQWLPKISHHQQKVCFGENKIETKKFIARIKSFLCEKWESYWDKERNTKSVQRELLAWLKAYDRYPHLENSLTFTFLIIISYHLSSSQVIFIRLCQNTYNAGKGLIFQSGLASNWCVSYTCFLPKYLSVVEMILSLITLCLFQAGCAWEQCHNVSHLSW